MTEHELLDFIAPLLGVGIAALLGLCGWIIRVLWSENIQNRLALENLKAHLEHVRERLEELSHQLRKIEEAFYGCEKKG